MKQENLFDIKHLEKLNSEKIEKNINQALQDIEDSFLKDLALDILKSPSIQQINKMDQERKYFYDESIVKRILGSRKELLGSTSNKFL